MTSTLYALNNPPVKNAAFTFPVVLYQQADTKLIKTTPTLATGDVKVGYEGQAPTTNIATLPSTDASGRLEVSLSAAEMNHNQVTVKFSDASGAEWCDLLVTFSTVEAVPVLWTQAASSVQAALAGDVLTILRGDTWSVTLTDLPANTGYVSVDFTLKTSRADADTEAIICVRKNASGLTDGLLYLNGATAATPAHGSITVVSSTSITIALAAAATDDLTPASGLQYDVQYITANGVTTATEGVCNVTADVRRAIA